MSKNDYKFEFEKNGFLLLKNIFEEKEILNLINLSLDEKKEDPSGYRDILTYKHLYKILINPRLIKALKDVLGPEITFMCDSQFHVNMITKVKSKNLLHRDNQNNYDPSTQIDVVRCGVYLNDYSKSSGNVKVGVGSHKSVRFNIKNLLRLTDFGCNLLMKRSVLKVGSYQKEVKKLKFSQLKWNILKSISTKPGDLVFWNLRTLHQGYAKKLKLLPKITLSAFWEHVLPNFLFYPGPDNRNAIFFVVSGKISSDIDEYADHRFDTIDKKTWKIKPSEEIIQKLKNTGYSVDLRGFSYK